MKKLILFLLVLPLLTTAFAVWAEEGDPAVFPDADTPIYDGSPHPLINAGGNRTGCMWYYCRGDDNVCGDRSSAAYSPDIPTETNAGSYSVHAYCKAVSDEYTDTERIDLTPSIKPLDVILDWDHPKEFEYDGQEHVPTVSVANIIENDDVSVTVTGGQRNAGDYTYTATGLGGKDASNYNWAFTDEPTNSFSITPIMLEITWSDNSFVYDGDPKIPTAYVKEEKLVDGDTCYASVHVEGDSINVGNYVATIEGLYTDENYTTQAGNYTLAEGAGTQDYEITPITVSITWAPTSFEYDGSAKIPTATVGGLIEGDVCTAVVKVTEGENDVEEAINAGNYTATVTGLTGADAGNYQLPDPKPSTEFSIAKKSLNVEWDETPLTYNGEEQASALSSDLPTGSSCTIEIGGKNKNAGGPYTATASLSEEGCGNYEIPADKTTQSYSIGKKEVSITWGDDTEFTYDGSAKIPTATVGGLIEGDVCTAVVKVTEGENDVDKAINAGNYTATVDDLTGADAGNYQLPDPKPSTEFSIAKKSLTVTWKDTSLEYNGSAQKPSVESDLPEGSSCSITVTGEGTTVSSTYTATASLGDEGCGNYEIPADKKEQTFEITPLTATIGWSSDSFTYDGTEKVPTAEVNNKVGNDVVTVTVEGAKIDAGENYTATAAELTGDDAGNYQLPDPKPTKEFSIAKANIAKETITLDPSAFLYNGENQKPRLDAGNLQEDEDFEIAEGSDMEASEVGEYTITLNGLGNYTGSVDLKWAIIQPSPEPEDSDRKEVKIENDGCQALSLGIGDIADSIQIEWTSDNSSVVSVESDSTMPDLAVVCGEGKGVAHVTAVVKDNNGRVIGTYTWRFVVERYIKFERLDGWDVFRESEKLPATGFASGVKTPLAIQPATLQYMNLNATLMIPSLNVAADLVSVPAENGEFAVEWLRDQAGIPAHMALPGEGHSVIVAHNHTDLAEAGPFMLIGTLESNDRVFVEVNGEMKSFSVYANELLEADDVDRMIEVAEQEIDSIVLLTCENEDVEGGYTNRRAIFAKPN